MPGRPKRNRVKEPNEEQKKRKQTDDTNEKMSRQGREMTCGNCNEIGHNKRSCKKPKPPSENVSPFNLNVCKLGMLQMSSINNACLLSIQVEGDGTSTTNPKTKAKKKTTTKDNADAGPSMPRIYKKTRNEGRKKVTAMQEDGTQPRKRGRPAKAKGQDQVSGVGVFVSPTGDTYYRVKYLILQICCFTQASPLFKLTLLFCPLGPRFLISCKS